LASSITILYPTSNSILASGTFSVYGNFLCEVTTTTAVSSCVPSIVVKLTRGADTIASVNATIAGNYFTANFNIDVGLLSDFDEYELKATLDCDCDSIPDATSTAISKLEFSKTPEIAIDESALSRQGPIAGTIPQRFRFNVLWHDAIITGFKDPSVDLRGIYALTINSLTGRIFRKALSLTDDKSGWFIPAGTTNYFTLAIGSEQVTLVVEGVSSSGQTIYAMVTGLDALAHP
jgi:hypothetical protein